MDSGSRYFLFCLPTQGKLDPSKVLYEVLHSIGIKAESNFINDLDVSNSTLNCALYLYHVDTKTMLPYSAYKLPKFS